MVERKISLKTILCDSESFKELFQFEGSESLTEPLVFELIELGWEGAIFEQIQVIASDFNGDGNAIVAYYNKERDSILLPGQEMMGSFSTFEFKKDGTVQLHGLPRNQGGKNVKY